MDRKGDVSGFLAELGRRNVIRVAVAYLVSAWVIIQVVALAAGAFDAPAWVMRFLIVFIVIGFPVALLLSWLFEITADGIKRDSGLAPGRGVVHVTARKLDVIVIMLLIVGIGMLVVRGGPSHDTTATAGIDSIAVLPFVNMSGNSDDEYFGDGLAEELLNALAKIEGLRVAARTSSFRYRGIQEDAREISRALGVASLLEGSVRRAGGRVRINAQLIRADDGMRLWSEAFDRNLEDIFAVQDEIAAAIVQALRVTMGEEGLPATRARQPVSVAAFEAYLRGRYEMHKRTESGLMRAMEEFRAAIQEDSDYAPALSGLADTWLLLAGYGLADIDEAVRQAQPLAERALDVDGNLAEAHTSMGGVQRYRRAPVRAIESFEHAISLNPSYTLAYHWLALTQAESGDTTQAILTLQRALEVDPAYVAAKRVLLQQLWLDGRDAEATALAESMLDMHRDDVWALRDVGSWYFDVGNFNRAIICFQRAVELDPGHSATKVQLLFALYEHHDRRVLGEFAARLVSQHPDDPFVLHQAGQALLYVGRDAEANAALSIVSAMDMEQLSAGACRAEELSASCW